MRVDVQAIESQDQEPTDEQLVLALATGRQEALGPLYARYAPLIFTLAAQSLDAPAAEEIVQDVFLVVWRKAATFDPSRGDFRPWVLQIAHTRVLNELRRRRRRPQLLQDPEGEHLDTLHDPDLEPADAIWREHQRSEVRAALHALPPSQRQAVGLAFLEDRTHQQVAATLDVPLGTAKTRIRAGLQKLRGHLAPLMVGLALVGLLAGVAVRYQSERTASQRHERALRLVTASDIQPLRLTAVPGVPGEAHGTYRGRADADIAVLTLSKLPPAPNGQVYQGWTRRNGVWTSLGTAQIGPDGRAIIIAEGPELAGSPAAVMVTTEPFGGSQFPTGPVMIRWSSE